MIKNTVLIQTINVILSYDAAVFQCLMSCHVYDHTCINTLAGTSNIKMTSVTTLHYMLK